MQIVLEKIPDDDMFEVGLKITSDMPSDSDLSDLFNLWKGFMTLIGFGMDGLTLTENGDLL